MIRVLRIITLILICFIAIVTTYLAIIKPSEIKNIIMADSFGFSSKDHDTLFINYSISEEEIKDILFTVHCFSTEYGGEGFLISGVHNGESVFDRKFELIDSTLIYGTQKIRVGDTFEDIQQYKYYRNVFKSVRNRLSLKNEGFIKVVKVETSFPADQQTIILKKPILLITGNSYDSIYTNSFTMSLYKMLPYILIFLGLTFWLLSFIIRIKSKIKHNH